MKNLKFLIASTFLMLVSVSFGQTSQATFESEAAVWQQSEAGHVATFTISAGSEALALIKERYDGLGSSVKYAIASIDQNTHTITMTFSHEVSAVYLHKMLLFIGCQTVVINESSMSMDDFMNYLLK